MTRKILTALCVIILFHSSAQAEYEIVALQSTRLKPFDEALKGFRSICNAKITKLVVSESGQVDVADKVQKMGPDMVLAVGNEALSIVKAIKNIPIVYLMVLNPESMLTGEKNITGVSINLSPDKQLLTLMTALPGVKKIGIIYDPARTGYFVKRIQNTATRLGSTLITKKIHNSRDMPSVLKDMKGKIDAFWMLPDLTVITPETVEFLFLFCIENSIPVITFSEKYVEVGALLSIGIDAIDIGIQAGEMAQKILSTQGMGRIQLTDARKAVVSINPQIARRTVVSINQIVARNLEVRVDETIMGQAHKVN